MKATTPVVSFVGSSGSGKTTFVEKLIREFKRRGLRLAVIKHHHQPDFEFDVPGKDSYRFAQAGADQVLVAGPTKIVHVRRIPSELALQEVIDLVDGVDLVITEGYKRAGTPQIEVSRRCEGRPTGLVSAPGQLVAIVADQVFDVSVPQYGLEDVAGVADLIESRFL